MIGKARLRYLDLLQKLTRAFLAATKLLQDRQSLFIAQCFEYTCLRRIVLRTHTSHQ